MNKKVFIATLLVTLLLFVISLLFSYGLATACFLISVLFIIETKNALNTSKEIFSYNPMKNYYRVRGKLEKYRKFTIVNFIIFFLIGILSIIFSITGIVDW